MNDELPIPNGISEPTQENKYIPIPTVLGKFNYVTYDEKTYNILFLPFTGSSAIIVVRNLTFDEAKELVLGLNHELEETRQEIQSRHTALKHKLRERRQRKS